MVEGWALEFEPGLAVGEGVELRPGLGAGLVEPTVDPEQAWLHATVSTSPSAAHILMAVLTNDPERRYVLPWVCGRSGLRLICRAPWNP